MKKIITVFIISLYSWCALAQENKFEISGMIKEKNDGFLYLSYYNKSKKFVIDSAAVIDKKFSFQGEIEGPRIAYLTVRKNADMDDLNSTSFYIEPNKMEISLLFNDFKGAKITGSATELENKALKLLKLPINNQLKPFHERFSAAYKAYAQAKKEKAAQSVLDSLHQSANDIREFFVPFDKKLDELDYRFIAAHPNSYLSAFLLSMQLRNLKLDSALLFYNSFSTKVKQIGIGKELGIEIEKLQKGSPGALAYTFSSTDINGKPLRLTDFKGKYVLLDFWASWCIPCRAGNPHLKKLYAQYKSKGFEIIGIADDDKTPQAWRNAVKQDEIGIWKHVLRGAKDANTANESINNNFLISSLPTKILIDKDGKIIGRYGDGGESNEAMDKKLTELMGK